ncbi:ABC-2 transporter permease [Lachnospiraceae bacterium 38-14]|uniref:ABC-2 transporter permease n=1 Tax=Roseburia sp. 1XD42-69 TaxID=2320088 RepID=UPI000EA2A213|nr:ABC-2 transporter permease [Roseburia sp. 1XD42-69]RKJ63335.1 ABC-2 transporter permease [Roseburia sp. 1XD42-69]
MKGLLKNNFLTVYSNAKVFSIFMLILGLFVVAVISQPLLIGYVLLSMVGFSVNAITSIKKELISKWGKYKLTLPVKRATIVKSYFISQLIWLLVGILYAGIVISSSWALHGCPYDNSIDVVSIFALGISVSIFTGAFFFPLLYLGGEERSDVFLVISLLCGIGVVLGIISVLNLYLVPGVITILLSAAILLLSSLLMFSLSYPLTVRIYHKKEY